MKTQPEHTGEGTFTASDLLFQTLQDAGVEYIFANLGSDHPAIIETWAKYRARGEKLPQVVVCPHEMVALSAAHGFTQATGRLQAVLVHVDVGTQNLGGAVHNAMRGRIPVFIFSGASPVTLDGELPGSRNEFIHYLQDVFDQRGIVREYVKWDHDLHAGDNIDLIVKRALQIANSEPRGPVYVMSPREMLERPIASESETSRVLEPIRPSGLAPQHAGEIASALAQAKFPLMITSYLGRNHEAVRELVALSERLAIPVMEAGPYYMNFPSDHPMHLGFEDFVNVNPYLEKADVVVVLDCDIPWMPQKSRRAANGRLYWIDSDPLKESIPLWYYTEEIAFRADACVALRQIQAELDSLAWDADEIERRRKQVTVDAANIRKQWESKEQPTADGVITPEFLSRTIREVIDKDTIIVNETISNYSVVWKHLRRTEPGTLFGSGASSLGWHGGAAIGVKLAHPDRTVVALTGDGSFVFSVPSAVQLVAEKYKTPFLTVIYNNGGWKSPKLSTLAVHPDGAAKRNSDFHVEFPTNSSLERIAEAAGDAFAVKVTDPKQLKPALMTALDHVKDGRSAVVNVMIEKL
ncbi:thiamine pyrophosphate-requiring protein [Ferviditalea candida]|uniref:Thiamine pyrophosphate-requiring protein n=1 Tax=Ferviditalea candida TaxID=3108399 RepID=A0ABU5ZJ85_9BACL|nr:thiamine pyrophosphate-requiring protein [Paenibacillaceae bacterium T2]